MFKPRGHFLARLFGGNEGQRFHCTLPARIRPYIGSAILDERPRVLQEERRQIRLAFCIQLRITEHDAFAGARQSKVEKKRSSDCRCSLVRN